MTHNEVKVTRRKLTDYTPDAHNANKGSQRGEQVIRQSFERNGAGRSLLADKDGRLIAGNQALKGAAAAGIQDAIEIEVTGDAVVVVKRVDLDLESDDGRARSLAYYDNRSSETSLTWAADQLAADLEAGVLPAGLFRDDELDDLLADKAAADLVNDAVNAPKEGKRLTADKSKQVKPVLYVDEIATVEAALAATGINNRGQAFLEVCRVYLAGREQGGDKDQ
jgi:hypothetical protein